jgi:hypothetical protein
LNSQSLGEMNSEEESQSQWARNQELARTYCKPDSCRRQRTDKAGVGDVTVFGRKSCALNSANICIKSPQSDWPLGRVSESIRLLPSQHLKPSPDDSGRKSAEMLTGCRTVQHTSLITTGAKRRAETPDSAKIPKDRSQDMEDTVWVTMKTSTSSGESSDDLAEASLQNTHSETLGAPDQCDPENLRDPKIKMTRKVITSKGCQSETLAKDKIKAYSIVIMYCNIVV